MINHMRDISDQWRLPPARAGYQADADLANRRGMLEKAPSPYPALGEVTVRGANWNGCPGFEIEAPGARRTIVYLHGGGYRLGSAAHWYNFAAHLAVQTAARIILPDYPLAPESPFPGAIRAMAGLWDALADSDGEMAGKPLFVGGDSAGGGLACALTLAARAAGRRLPDGVLLLSPWLDLTLAGDSFVSRKDSDTMFPIASARVATDTYLQGHDPRDPLASPLLADLAGFPPTLLLAGGAETLMSDSLAFSTRLADAGATVSTHIFAGLQHVWPVTSPQLPATREAIDLIVRFMDNRL
jgi:monoterpene epsilon-lactone hydrolase